MGKRVAIITVNYGTAAEVLDRLSRYVGTLGDIEARVFIVDNASPGDDGAMLEAGVAAMAPLPVPVTVIRAPVNGGFASGNNVALARLRKGDWQPDAVLLLNPDAEPEAGAVETLFDGLMAHSRAGFVGPNLVNEDGSTWSAAFHFPSWRTEVLRPLGIGVIDRVCPLAFEAGDGPQRVDWIGGAALMIRWSAIEALGNLDEGFFLYLEEIDYQREAARQGWEAWHIPSARVIHVAGETTGIVNGMPKQGRMPGYLFESWTRYFAKNHGIATTRLIAAFRLVTILLGQLKGRLRGQRGPLPDRFVADYLSQVLLRRLDPLPCSDRAGKTAAAIAAQDGAADAA